MEKGCDYLQKLYDETRMGAAWFSWYDFPQSGSVLLTGDVSAAAVRELEKRFLHVEVYAMGKKYARESFAAVLVAGGLGSPSDNDVFLRWVKDLLTPEGVLLWCADNKLGTRFLCGDVHLTDEGEYFTHRDWEDMFREAGCTVTCVYGLMPGWHMPRNIFTAECPLKEDNLNRSEYYCANPELMFRDEREMVEDLVRCGVFFSHANGFIFEYRRQGGENSVLMGDVSPDKGDEASAILRCADGTFEKKPLFADGSVEKIFRHGEELRQRGLKTVPQEYKDSRIVMPVIRAPLLSRILAKTADASKDDFRALLEKFWVCILQSSDTATCSSSPFQKGDYGVILQRAYTDMTPTNAFYMDGEYVFFDQEYSQDNYPAKFVLYRALVNLYAAEP